jgi:hypothetical protein
VASVAKDTIWEKQVADDPDDDLDIDLIPWDDQERRSMQCRSCLLPRVFRRRRTRHSLHFLFALGTLGLALPIWGINIILQLLKPWTCSVCGRHQRDN